MSEFIIFEVDVSHSDKTCESSKKSECETENDDTISEDRIIFDADVSHSDNTCECETENDSFINDDTISESSWTSKEVSKIKMFTCNLFEYIYKYNTNKKFVNLLSLHQFLIYCYFN